VGTSPLDKDEQYHSVVTPECENEELPSLTDNYPSMPEITVTANGTEKILSKLESFLVFRT
jgi:hypothetical protein